MIDQIKLRHQKVHRNHSHKGRKHSEHHRNLHHRFARRERKTRHGIGGQNHQKRAEDAAACRHKKCIGKPARIVVQCRIRKQPFEARQTVSGREKTVKRIDRSRFGKRCQDQPQARKEEYKRHCKQYEIGHSGIEDSSCGHPPLFLCFSAH